MTPTLPKSRHFLIPALAVLLLCLGTPLAAQAKDNWISVESKNFRLVGNASEKEIRQVATKLEQFRDVFTRLFANANFKTPVPTTVIVFKSMSSYKPFTLPNAAGYFQKGEDVNYITLTTERSALQNPFEVIYHEYIHLLVDNTSGSVPSWFNEGLAEYYSTFEIEDDRKVHLGELIPSHIFTLREEKLLPLRKLFEIDHYSREYNESSKRGIFYAQSWALVHYLILANNGQRRPQLGKFINLIAAKVKTEDAFKQAFQTEVETLEKELKKYIDGNTFKMQVATFERKLEFDSELKVTPLSEADAQAYLGDLLLHTNRLKDAEKRLEQALALDPKQTMAHASLGILRAREQRFDEARKALQEAVKGNSSNYLAHYYYAYALSREGIGQDNLVHAYAKETSATMRAELTKAIELNPNFPESYALLAFISLVSGEELDKAVELLKRALTLSPGRQDLALQLGQVHMRQQKLDLAKQVLEPLRSAKDRQLKSHAESLLKSIKNYEEQVAENDALMLQRRQETPGNTSTQNEPGKPISELDYLHEALRPVEAGEERIQGVLMKLECDRAVAYFIVQSGEGTHKIRATALDQVQLTAFVPSANEITCGARTSPENVVVTFRPSTDPKDVKARIKGDAIAVELVPKGFQLKK